MAQDATAFQLRSPAVLVIGHVAACQVLDVAGAVAVADSADLLPLPLPASAEPLLRRSA
ncbi:hypothetical protein D3C75_1390430 [compost metagenome]